ncbi:MAG: Substrate-binding region of ABC-type glycine betaine transport system [Glaciihabitans sp.]|nr:Substrate-binding region of ABC-type glycine betaine transport system [Glaciihabitans sp.]
MALRRTRPRLYLSGLALASAAALTLSGCSSVNAPAEGDVEASDCTVSLAMNDWVGYTADAAVYTNVAESLGCTVTQKPVSEEVAWQGFGSGEVDVIIENWGHPDLIEKYVDGDKTATAVGPTGNVGKIGWFVPPWMVDEYPDILDWNNLNKYADLFVTSESGGKGQLLLGDPSFVSNDPAIVTNLGLDFEPVFSGSEAALIESFRAAEENKTPLLGYFYDPQWFLSEVPIEMVNLPEYTEGCDADPETVACGYPEFVLDKIASSKWVATDNAAVKLLDAFTWTNDDQNLVAKYISEDGMTAEEAAQKWVDDNPDVVSTWTS